MPLADWKTPSWLCWISGDSLLIFWRSYYTSPLLAPRGVSSSDETAQQAIGWLRPGSWMTTSTDTVYIHTCCAVSHFWDCRATLLHEAHGSVTHHRENNNTRAPYPGLVGWVLLASQRGSRCKYQQVSSKIKWDIYYIPRRRYLKDPG